MTTLGSPSTTQSSTTLVAGIGSPHGDDQAGWRVIDRLEALNLRDCRLYRAKVPHELIDQTDGVSKLHLIDATAATSERAVVEKFEITVASDDTAEIAFVGRDDRQTMAATPRLRSGSTHHIDLVSVLQLAKTLGRLPSTITLWAIPARRFGPGESIGPSCEVQIRRCVSLIAEELGDA